MASDFKSALAKRRSYYDITDKSPIADDAIKELVEYAVMYTPSAFNSQSARTVLLFGAQHKRLWEIVLETLRKVVPAEKFQPTEDKIGSFAAGHGTILFYEDQAVILNLQQNYPLYSDMFPGFSENSAGMLQLAVWVMLRDVGLGASLQHYGNLIEEGVASEWGIDPKWKLVAQMPFGTPNSEPGPKEQLPLSARVRVFS